MRVLTVVMRTVTLGVLLALASFTSAEQVYPSKPIRIVVSYPPSGGADPVARIVAQKLAEKWSQPTIVDNRPGGNTLIGNDAVAKAPPDGYTLLLTGTSLVILPSLLRHIPYDTIKDFDAVATVSKSRYVLVVNPSVPANNLQEFIALAKAKPGQLNYGSGGGVGTPGHLATVLFESRTGVTMQHIP